ncbi:BlaI/MecI/CopY family transcriptional regulator [Verrucomicrobium sp. BvORR106]|uniref:BlaI/MecI/CopY family transcriptional regulator n=1 Tax=Verrucomicrobium sp. BvORR106 TaxID=1403819 RepID=UPI00068F320B|nr:BlaI/MecI/CopY family transcriptional regulator [Verrucomicrobium sp. BvORR106]
MAKKAANKSIPAASPTPTPTPRPTDAELAILRVLWAKGAATVREILDAINEDRIPPLVYTTVLTFLQIMTDKGLVLRDTQGKTHVYRAAVAAEKTQRHLVKDVLERVFSGSVSQLVMHALGSRKISADEVREIKAMLNEIDHTPPTSK